VATPAIWMMDLFNLFWPFAPRVGALRTDNSIRHRCDGICSPERSNILWHPISNPTSSYPGSAGTLDNIADTDIEINANIVTGPQK
jgi:hypothetical protein